MCVPRARFRFVLPIGTLVARICDIFFDAADPFCEPAPMISLLSSFREIRASLGLGNGLLFALARLVNRTTRGRSRLLKYYFVAQPVPPKPSPAFSRPSKTRIYRAVPGDVIIQQFPRPPQVITKRFADGALCFVAEQAGRLVGFLWIKQESYCEDEVRCHYFLHPPDQLVWDFDTYVAPEFRMSRAFAQLWEAANEFLRERGYRWSISRISAFNAGSLASHRRLGIVHLNAGIFLVSGPVQLAAFSQRPFLHVAIGPRHSPKRDFHAPVERPSP